MPLTEQAAAEVHSTVTQVVAQLKQDQMEKKNKHVKGNKATTSTLMGVTERQSRVTKTSTQRKTSRRARSRILAKLNSQDAVMIRKPTRPNAVFTPRRKSTTIYFDTNQSNPQLQHY